MLWLALLCVLLAITCGYLLWRVATLNRHSVDEMQQMESASGQLAAHAANFQDRLNALSESSGAGVLILDRNGKVIETNSATGRILETDPSGLIGHALIQGTMSSELQDFVVQVGASGRPLSQDFQMPGSRGRILRASVYPLAVGLSGVPEMMLVLVDVTELHRLETIRRDFVANVSHELRTPLASIRAIAETLHEGALQDEEVASPFLETIIREADRLARISQDLLVLSDAESKEPAKDWFDLSVLIRDVVGRSRKHAEHSGVTLNVRVQPEIPLLASRDQIEQVLVNLVDNAIKYTLAQGSVCVEAFSDPEAVIVSVKDTGIGIMHQDLPRIFERFYRVDKARSRESGGTGLGLSIVKNIVEAHGGDVKVVSEYNRGSTFTVTLPKES